jgi:Flp pilus assembly protein TadD
MLAGCLTPQSPEISGSLVSTPALSETDWRREGEAAGALYRADPSDPHAAIRYAKALRAIGERAQASAVLEQASIRNPNNHALLGAYGRALADTGNYQQALEVLNRAHTPDQPDWRILSVQGTVLDQLGQHQEARRYYASALKLAPDEPSVLSNLGLSYALSKDLVHAEESLRRAAARPGADPRVHQNLALIVGLEGRFQEAERMSGTDLPPQEAAANIAYLRQMLAPQATADRSAASTKAVARRASYESAVKLRGSAAGTDVSASMQLHHPNRRRAENDYE